MKILLLTTFDVKQDMILENCKNQYQMFTYFIYNKFKLSNLDVILHNIGPTGFSGRVKKFYQKWTCPQADHCLIIDNRGVIKRPQMFLDKIREKVLGCVSTISASNGIVGNEDILFYLIPSGKRRKFKCRYIGWACDDQLCYSNQNKDNIRILIDHVYYGQGRIKNSDKTLEISKQAVEYFKNNDKVAIRRLCNGGVETVDENNYNTIGKYNQNKGMSFEKACEEYSLSDVYFVTHQECMGLVVLECAMSGALIVTPKNYIKYELIKSLHHLIYENNEIPWDEIIKTIDHNKSRQKAQRFSWTNSCNTMMDTFVNWESYRSKLVFRNIH